MSESTEYDVVIVGGGLIGATLALALEHLPLRIALLEAVAYESDAQPSFDDRAIALGRGTRRTFEAIQIWSDLCDVINPIEKIVVSEQGRFGKAHLSAQEEGVDALGHVVVTRKLGQILIERLPRAKNLTFICPAEVTSIELSDDAAEISLANGQRLVSSLLVAADGASSSVRQMLQVGKTVHDYGQRALVTNIATTEAHKNSAYERFTADGPLALLPMSQHRTAVVWTIDAAVAEQRMQWSEQMFLAELQKIFGYGLGEFKHIGKRVSYPLRLVRSAELTRHRTLFVGNAANSLHPVAGQGFNLGVRDVACLAELIQRSTQLGKNWLGSEAMLSKYVALRRSDHRNIVALTDGLAKIFVTDFGLLAHSRGLGIQAFDLMPPMKRLFARHAMGQAGALPKLLRGVALT
ncbi:MAG TPA: 2-octaprenyl-6-methoxyphenyl hydroxylase [Gammaproteobacteria bacterium]|nr:2-octaprenyl-6-methoxyphenyl hydroxylase [Gammaproteobacteria bacterium]